MEENMNVKEETEFIPRPYQIDLYEKAVNSNLIIYLPTGSGKTYISIMLIKKLSSSITRPYSQGGKRTVFVVNSVALVTQQSKYIERFTGLSCGAYCGEIRCDYWSDKEWLEELNKHEVLVLTSQILLDILCHGVLSLNRLNLLIFDECHRAVNDHPMRLIMQRFEKCPKSQQPRVLALSATLLNKNIKFHKVADVIKELEETFHATIATVSTVSSFHSFSTNPSESIVKYSQYILENSLETQLEKWLNDATNLLKVITLKSNIDYSESSKEFQPRDKNAKLISIIEDTKTVFNEMGVFGGTKVIILHLIQLEALKKNNQIEETTIMYQYIITQLIKASKLFNTVLSDSVVSNAIFQHSSDKVRKLFKILKDFNDNTTETFCCIIFTERRFTAMTLYHILKDLKLKDENYKFLIPDYVIGFSSDPHKSSREGLCNSKWNKAALQRFRNGLTNCLVATNCIEEGVDIPMCTLIVQYDPPVNVRSYIQSRGRARHNASNYVIMLSELDEEYITKLAEFKRVESYLKQLLIGNSDNRSKPLDEDIQKNLYNDYIIKPYMVKNKDGIESIITEVTAIPIINRYCSTLYRSKFVTLTPVWILHKIDESSDKYQVSLQIPNISPLKEPVYGEIMPSIESAKRSAAMKTCIKLHELEELSDHLLPRNVNIIESKVNYLFPHWVEENDKNAGTHKKKRIHKLEYPSALYNAYPNEEKDIFLHVISCEPVYSVPQESRPLKFYSLLNNLSGYGILSTKSLPSIPNFPIFMNVGELAVKVLNDFTKIRLSEYEIQKLKIFHSLIFINILEIVKSFMIFDNDNLENCFLIAPLTELGDINWDVVNDHQTIEIIDPIPPESADYNDYETALVTPNYRGASSVYIVTDICDDLTPSSCFPTDDFYTYADYYKERHQIKIKKLDQPMLEVKPISKKFNCIKPRDIKPGLSKRKRADILEDFEEHLVPELCNRIRFPALYWLKATTLPSILHRIYQILIAEDLRIKICMEANLGKLSHSQLRPLIIKNSDSDDNMESQDQASSDESIISFNSESEVDKPDINVLDAETNIYPWSNEQEPTDLYRNAEKIQVIDIEYYHQFISTEEVNKDIRYKSLGYLKKPNLKAPILRVLNNKGSDGPSPLDLMEALTTKGRDVFNLERLETMGDAFLKYITSLYLYHVFPTYNEGRLTVLKGQILGNKNLFYCGRKKEIPGRMKVEDFLPQSTFIPPAFNALRKWRTDIIKKDVSPSVLYEVKIPFNDKLTGTVSQQVLDYMETKMVEYGQSDNATGMEHFVGVQIITDKTVADSVEALIAVYLQSLGVVGATKLLSWFGILPEDINVDLLLNVIAFNPQINSGDPNIHLPLANRIEERIGYTFKNRAYLLQALTHPSYTPNILTECYQRLEFLGDALLDFLITSYIYENCGDLTPGELTDLRSALVNNVTFACLTVKYGLHIGLLAYSPKLNDSINRFVKFQEERNHVVNDELLWILMEEDECNIAEYVDVPKILGDIFESVIGAIYLDSNKNMNELWNIIYALMHKEIIEFSKDVPKQPIRLLLEMPTTDRRPQFGKAEFVPETNVVMVPLEVFVSGSRRIYHGFGATKKQARCAAAKQALQKLRTKL